MAKVLCVIMLTATAILTLSINADQGQPSAVNIVDSGNSFLTVCRNALDYTTSSLTCFGFVQGFLEGMRVSEEVELNPADKDKIRVCIPDGANVEQVLKVIIKFIDENPERSHNPTRHLAYTALVHAFRCPK